jgi:hypothetical protein
MSCPVCDSPYHVHCSIGCERCSRDENNPHPIFAEKFCRTCKKSLCFRCLIEHVAECPTEELVH